MDLRQPFHSTFRLHANPCPTLPNSKVRQLVLMPLRDSPFLKACRREPTDVTPIWLMRQAGRYMAEYRAVRAKVPFLELCKDPDLATEVTVTAAERLGVDAAILFADILLILEPLGFDLEFAKGEGPVIHNPVRDGGRRRPRPPPGRPRAARLRAPGRPLDPLGACDPTTPLIGFAGAPFTLACYAIEGGGSRHYEKAKAFMYRDPGAWDALMDGPGRRDGRLPERPGRRRAPRRSSSSIAGSATSAPTTTAGSSSRTCAGSSTRLDPDVPVDPLRHRHRLAPGTPARRRAARHRARLAGRARPRPGTGSGRASPCRGTSTRSSCFAPLPEIERQARRILDQAAGRPGHIFNLGHGILPHTPVDHVLALVDMVHVDLDLPGLTGDADPGPGWSGDQEVRSPVKSRPTLLR